MLPQDLIQVLNICQISGQQPSWSDQSSLPAADGPLSLSVRLYTNVVSPNIQLNGLQWGKTAQGTAWFWCFLHVARCNCLALWRFLLLWPLCSIRLMNCTISIKNSYDDNTKTIQVILECDANLLKHQKSPSYGVKAYREVFCEAQKPLQRVSSFLDLPACCLFFCHHASHKAVGILQFYFPVSRSLFPPTPALFLFLST